MDRHELELARLHRPIGKERRLHRWLLRHAAPDVVEHVGERAAGALRTLAGSPSLTSARNGALQTRATAVGHKVSKARHGRRAARGKVAPAENGIVDEHAAALDTNRLGGALGRRVKPIQARFDHIRHRLVLVARDAVEAPYLCTRAWVRDRGRRCGRSAGQHPAAADAACLVGHKPRKLEHVAERTAAARRFCVPRAAANDAESVVPGRAAHSVIDALGRAACVSQPCSG